MKVHFLFHIHSHEQKNGVCKATGKFHTTEDGLYIYIYEYTIPIPLCTDD